MTTDRDQLKRELGFDLVKHTDKGPVPNLARETHRVVEQEDQKKREAEWNTQKTN